jgi:hypothetical protein
VSLLDIKRFECREIGSTTWRSIAGISEDDAAETFTELSNDYDGEGPEDLTVVVRQPGEEDATKWKTFEVEAEQTVIYNAVEKS